MSRIILITGTFYTHDKFGIINGEEFVVSHGIDEDSGKTIIMDQRHPRNIHGSFYDKEMGEWVIDNETE